MHTRCTLYCVLLKVGELADVFCSVLLLLRKKVDFLSKGKRKPSKKHIGTKCIDKLERYLVTVMMMTIKMNG